MLKRVVGLSIIFIVLVAGSFGSGSPPDGGRTAIQGGSYYTITSGIIQDGVLLIENGKIKEIGKNIPIPPGFRTISAKGKIIIPGLISAFSQVGLEGDFVASDSLESSETLTPQMRAIDGFYPFSKSIARLRNRGVTVAAVFPGPGNVISGQGAIIKMSGPIKDDMAVNPLYGLLFTLGEKSKKETAMPKTRMGEMYLLKNILLEAQRYREKWAAPEKTQEESPKPAQDLRLDPLVSLLEGRTSAFFYCDKVQDIMNSLALAETHKFRLVLVDAQQASQVSDDLARRKIPVLVVPQKSLWWDIEKTTWDPENARKLSAAGVLIAIIPGEGARFGDEELALYAAYAVRYGLPEDEALKAITLYPARILGIEGKLGSLEKGKDADLVIMDGHPFRIKTRVNSVFISGKMFEVKEPF